MRSKGGPHANKPGCGPGVPPATDSGGLLLAAFRQPRHNDRQHRAAGLHGDRGAHAWLGSAHRAVGFTDAARVAVTEAAVAGLLPTQPQVVTGRGHRALQAVEPVVVSMLIVSRAASPPTRRWLSTRLQTLLVHRADATRCLTFPTDRFRIGVLDRWLQNSPRRRDRYGPK